MCMYVVPQQPRLLLLQRRALILTPARPAGTQPLLKGSPLNLIRKRSLLALGARTVGSPLRWQSRKGKVLGVKDLRSTVLLSAASLANHLILHFVPCCCAAHPSPSCLPVSAGCFNPPPPPCPFALLGVRVAKLIRLNTFVVLQPGIHLFQKQKAKSGLR